MNPPAKPLRETPDDVSLCNFCNCMTHTVYGRCGKCHAVKAAQPDSSNELDRIITEHAQEVLRVEADPFGKNYDWVKAGNTAKAAILKHYISKAEAIAAIDKLPTTGRDYPNVYVPLYKLKQVLKLEES